VRRCKGLLETSEGTPKGPGFDPPAAQSGQPEAVMDTTAVLREYKRTGDVALRNQIIEQYMGIVNGYARHMVKKTEGAVDFGDMVQEGVFGLITAIDGFDCDRGVEFGDYCHQRVLGAMYDGIRDLDIVPRLVRMRARKIERAKRKLRAKLCREPSEQEVADKMGMGLEEYRRFAFENKLKDTLHLLGPREDSAAGNNDIRADNLCDDDDATDPAELVAKKQWITEQLRGFSRTERLIIILYYYEDLTMREIGDVVGLSESRVSQIHSGLMERLKDQMEARDA
jgi:RNA polymerase sigma factor for flagellar operon FliA